jgi:glyoxylase-like metal-dependent hydrolase (beta-lactamase superfamily II)
MTEAWGGGRLAPDILCVLAPNPGPMTLDGTNTYVLGEPGGPLVVVDPGPEHAGHRRAVLQAAAPGTVAAVVLTHTHPDHAEGAASFAAEAGCHVLGADPALGGLEAGLLELPGTSVEVVPTPGHTSDSVCLLVGRALLTGDTLLGRGTTVVAHPDGTLADYLDSLRLLADLARERGPLRLMPGHGPAGADVGTVVAQYTEHRSQRLDEVVAAVARGARSAEDVVATVYRDVPRRLWPAALLSVQAQLDHLVATGRLRRERGVLSEPDA